MRLLIDGQPLAVCLFTCFDSRVPADLHATAFGGDEARMTAVLERGGREASSVVVELSVRLGWPAALATARGRLPVVLRRESDPAVLAAVLLRCADLGMLDRDLLAQALHEHCAAGALDRAAEVWSAFFAHLPADLLPPLFEVHRFLGRGADAVRLADSAARVRAALDCCLRSPRVEDAVAGLALAERSGAAAPILRALREHTAELHVSAGRYAEALPLFREADRPQRLSVCLEALGQIAQALECCPSNDPARIARLVDLALSDVDAAVHRGRRQDPGAAWPPRPCGQARGSGRGEHGEHGDPGDQPEQPGRATGGRGREVDSRAGHRSPLLRRPAGDGCRGGGAGRGERGPESVRGSQR
ncbi:hypothetical protein [Candidatus Frankia alpina]|uniref:hypothetical protein n=1 Tax=Candidatus Frankia alpina TaxID=2699483 RepID=UPI0013D494AA|nr:hypothetical protein [Candidatus Frankia alpina]